MTAPDARISFETGSVLLLPLLISVALLLATSYWMWQRTPRRRLPARMAANFLAIFALFALAARPHWRSQIRADATAVLFTAGAEKYSAQLHDSLNAVALKFALPDYADNGAHELKAIPDLGYLQRHFPEVQRLHVIGHGLPEYEWQEWPELAITPHFAALAPGFKYVHWKKSLPLGESLIIQGQIVCADSTEHVVTLIDPGGVADSVAVQPRESTFFTLRSKPRAAGTHPYKLQLRTETGRALAAEHVAVHVQPPQALRILILESAPNFETKYLKRWAAQQQSRLALRTTISRERYRYGFLNHPRIDLKRIHAELLRGSDLVITDAQTLQDLRAPERADLRTAVVQNGLGVLLLADEAAFKQSERNFAEANFFLPLQWEAFPELQERMVKPHWHSGEAQSVTALPAVPFEILPDWRSVPLARDAQERALVAMQQRGQGRIGFSLLRATYRWILEGHAEWHASYWSHLCSELARRAPAHDVWMTASDEPIYLDRPVDFTLITPTPQPVGVVAVANAPRDSIFLRQDEIEPLKWHGTFWPRTTGWHELSTGSGEETRFYVHAKEAWRTWQQAEKIAATSRHALRSNGRAHALNSRLVFRSTMITPAWFFALLLACCFFLWMERKL